MKVGAPENGHRQSKQLTLICPQFRYPLSTNINEYHCFIPDLMDFQIHWSKRTEPQRPNQDHLQASASSQASAPFEAR